MASVNINSIKIAPERARADEALVQKLAEAAQTKKSLRVGGASADGRPPRPLPFASRATRIGPRSAGGR